MTPEQVASRGRFDAVGTQVDLLTAVRLLGRLEQSITAHQKQRVIFCNVSSVIECRDNPALRDAIAGAEIVSPDGMPLVWLARALGHKDIERVDGPGFMRRAMQHGVSLGWRHYLYGGSSEVLDALCQRLRADIAGLEIAGYESPPFRTLTPQEDAEAITRINDSNADLVWVGLGMPKQELWMAAHQSEINAPILLGVGAAFNFHAGSVRRAPAIVQRLGLEWLYRFAQEPRRLWRRYLLGNTRFVWLAARQVFSARLRHS